MSPRSFFGEVLRLFDRDSTFLRTHAWRLCTSCGKRPVEQLGQHLRHRLDELGLQPRFWHGGRNTHAEAVFSQHNGSTDAKHGLIATMLRALVLLPRRGPNAQPKRGKIAPMLNGRGPVSANSTPIFRPHYGAKREASREFGQIERLSSAGLAEASHMCVRTLNPELLFERALDI